MLDPQMLNLFLITWALFAGLLMTRVGNIFKLPDVTAYLVVGVIIGPSILGKLGMPGVGFVGFDEVNRFSIISDIALGFIAFLIGAEFKLKNIKHIGKQAVVIALHVFMPDIVTVPMALILGAIATATAPAATLLVVKQYKAKGHVTDILLPVVALDDAVGLMVFAISSGIAQSLINGNVNIVGIIVEPIAVIVLSLLLGTVVAIILNELEKYFYSHSNRLILIIGSIILTVGVAKISFTLGGFSGSFSPLLVCMMLGTVFCNICPLADDLMERADFWSKPIIVLFFVLSGAELDLSVFENGMVVVIGIIYILTRSFGKYFGARISATMVGSPMEVRKYLGITLLPQAGVALGMSAMAVGILGEKGVLVRNITLFGVLIYELVGPTLTKIALIKSGDIKEEAKDLIKKRKALDRKRK